MKNPVIPVKSLFFQVDEEHSLDFKAIAVFLATGFFLDRDTYYKDLKVVPPATTYSFDVNGEISVGEHWFKWHYSPRDISFDQAVDEFTFLFEKITEEQTRGKEVILPLSGGLDSRSQAVALKAINHPSVATYSYKFDRSFDETSYGREIARRSGFSFEELVIPKGYLWGRIYELAEINQCYSDFTHPRQMAVIDEISKLGDLFFLGHWGDVLFDDMGISEDATEYEQLVYLKKKVLKKGGLELASEVWKSWNLEGNFSDYLDDRLLVLLRKIDIKNANARIRAFKSLYWAPRWTSVNLAVFSSRHETALPYYDNRMCEFICTIPEEYLAGRKMQIEYIKRRNPGVAAVRWQDFSPCNLYTYPSFSHPKYWPYRTFRKVGRVAQKQIKGQSLVLRNWENQFLGKENAIRLQQHLFENPLFRKLIPTEVTQKFYQNFRKKDPVFYSHPISSLLTLSVFSKRIK